MKEQNSAVTSLPDVATLASLAAQSRFNNLPSEKATEQALALWHDAQEVLARANGDQQRLAVGPIRQPQQWPAKLEDFYRLLVKGKDKAENQPRFKRFLCYQIETERKKIEEGLADATKELAETEATITRVAQREETLVRDLFPGTKTSQEAAQVLKQYISQQRRLLLRPRGADYELDKRFARWKTTEFDEPTWNRLASEYNRWWDAEKTANKARAGRARAAKAYAGTRKPERRPKNV